MSPLLAQAEGGGPDPDLTRPIAVIAVCVLIIVTTLVVQWVRRHRRQRPATPEALHAWLASAGHLLDQWIDGVEAELHALRTAPFPDTVTPSEDPLGLDRAIADCPDGPLAELVADLREAGADLLATARDGDPNRPDVAAAEARFVRVKERVAARLGDAPPAVSP
jgi:hypothetical protein